ncbi:B-cell receptor CD22-like [Polypterus senegalus]|uniref:B-cell receptor CD22-like n=1 Tax=Polypterus senegalus TaxID=55291 RepID=UPI0019628C6D|nr:B-cell receptor CD22-like [Polypterus senegalus]
MFLLVILAVVSSVADSNNMAVTYTPQTICTLEGSTVRINCKYDHPAEFTIQLEAWFYDHNKDNVYPKDGTIVYHTNRSQVPSSYTNRVQFFGNKNKICDVKISNVSRQESGEYKFRFEGTDNWTQKPGVSVTITGLIIQTTPETIKENDTVTLSCRANCSLNNTVFSWFRNGRPLNETSKDLQIQRVSTEDSVSYSCRAGNITSPERLLDVQFAPKNAVITGQPPACIEGTSVTLNCTALANPSSNYTWVKENSSQVGSGEQLHINEFKRSHDGSYHCEATNAHGMAKSAAITLTINGDVSCSGTRNLYTALYALLGVAVLVLLALGVFIFVR